jgi:hypothetical protein
MLIMNAFTSDMKVIVTNTGNDVFSERPFTNAMIQSRPYRRIKIREIFLNAQVSGRCSEASYRTCLFNDLTIVGVCAVILFPRISVEVVRAGMCERTGSTHNGKSFDRL